jgi:hypothetical protein
MLMRIARFIGVTLLLAGGLFYHADRAAAQVDDAARQACTPDAMRLCGDVIPDVAKVTACMKAKRALLSAPCRLVVNGGGRGRRVERGGHEGRHYYRYHHYSHHSRHSS